MSTSWKVIRADRLFDGTGSRPIENGVVVVNGDQIESVGTKDQVDLPTDEASTIFDLGDAMILPGLVDVHSHLVLPGDGTSPEDMMRHGDDILLMQATSNARRALFSGTTTLADMGARNLVGFRLRDGINMGLAVGPRLVLCGRSVTRTGGHCWYFNGEVDGPEPIRHTVRQLLKDGADVIKVMTTGGGSVGTDPFQTSYSLDELKAATEEAHAAGIKVAAHCSSSAALDMDLTAGFDMIFHAHFYEPGGRLNFQPDLARRLADSPAYVNPTLEVNYSQAAVLEERREQLTPAELRYLAYRWEFYKGSEENVGKLVQYGVKMVAGSDAGWGPNPFGELAAELEKMKSVGMTAHDVLLAATRNASVALGFGHLVGTLEKGKKADILAVGGDPTQNISAIRDVKLVMIDGDVVRRDSNWTIQA